MSDNRFGDFNLPDEYDASLVARPMRGTQFPLIAYLPQGSGGSGGLPVGLFYTEWDHDEALPAGWQAQELVLGDNDNPTACAVTRQCRVIAIAERRAFSITPDGGRARRYPLGARLSDDEQAAGRYKSLTNVMVVLPDQRDLFVLTAGGEVRGKSWDNPRPGKYPLGVVQLLEGLCAEITAERKLRRPFPWLCALEFTLAPATDPDNLRRPLTVKVGPNQLRCNPFTVDMTTVKFVGPDAFQSFLALAADPGLAWKAEWEAAPLRKDEGYGREAPPPSDLNNQDDIF